MTVHRCKMITPQIGSVHDVREKARKALADYLTMFLPESWIEPLAKLKIILQGNGQTDWESLKGQALLYYDQRRLSADRVDSLARVERLGESCKELHSKLSPAEWHKAIDDIIHAANFRASKAKVQTGRLEIAAETKILEPKKEQKKA
ncbi:MAG: hypothetical protein ACXAEB_10100 [Candidatus Thorarchaeota archaeon]